MAPQTLILATRNQGKVKELRDPLARFGFDVKSLPEDFPEVAETGSTFEENALIKAHAVADALDVPAVADDSGIEVDALGGAPAGPFLVFFRGSWYNAGIRAGRRDAGSGRAVKNARPAGGLRFGFCFRFSGAYGLVGAAHPADRGGGVPAVHHPA